EKREVEREEFGHEGQGVAYTLLGISAFAMMTVYLVHWNDDDVRRYAWEVLSALGAFNAKAVAGLESSFVPYVDSFDKRLASLCRYRYFHIHLSVWLPKYPDVAILYARA
ncbi:unnamed protein product, partial [Effrenium voratum]